MSDLIKIEINEKQQPIVNGRELHETLGIKTDYKKWFDRMCEYGFAENIDYCTLVKNVQFQMEGIRRDLNILLN